MRIAAHVDGGNAFLFGHDVLGCGLEVMLGGKGTALDDGIGDLGCKQLDGTQRIVVARDDVVHFIRIAIGVNDTDYGDVQAACFLNGNRFFGRIDDKDDVGEARHILDPGEVLGEVLALALESGNFLLRAAAPGAFCRHGFEFAQALDRSLDGQKVGEQATEPAVVDVVHPTTASFFGDGFLSLTFGSDEQDILALSSHFADIAHGVLEELERLLEVDDINSVAFTKDVLFHLWVPALGLVPEVHAGFEQFFH